MSEDTRTPETEGEGLSPGRRAVLGGLAGAAALTALQWTPAFRVGTADAAVPAPPSLPSGITAYLQAYRNWSGGIRVDDVWTCAPNTPADVVALANWAKAQGWTLRAKGFSHNWSPLMIQPGTPTNILLVDTTQHLTAVTVNAGSPASVTAQTGVSMESLLGTLEASGYGVTATPAPGDITLGGALAIDGHGTAVPKTGETLTAGHTFGSLSNLVVSLTAVVWDSGSSQYALRTFQRNDPAIAPLLVGLGRTFVTEVTLRVGANKRLRCQSYIHISADAMFASPATAGSDSFASWVDQAGRVEAIWFPYTSVPWLKVWSVAPSKPFFAKQVNAPYNYPFSDFLSQDAADILGQITAGSYGLTPTFCNTQMGVVGSGLIVTGSWDIWGWSKNLMLYIKPTTYRVTANGYAILTKRANIQKVVNEFYTYYKNALDTYAAQGRYPMNGPLEIRVTGLDNPADAQVAGAVTPTLSAIRGRSDHPEWDVAVWLDILTVPGTPYNEQFYRETEQFVLGNYSGTYAMVRPEWSKGWGYSGTAAWSDPTILGTTVPNMYRTGVPAGSNWDSAVSAFNQYDPYKVFSNGFLNGLLV
ncbi:cholesterol oxidase substrate-binding domain-containing protein [Yinghuangia seranimata]|uniref:cholesterol oxidase substrate-binding domain-containing protein n=1 Tax=Yinghuangia seranimata TaxID=408067 RepID=UPI00248C8030|nr:cholesterol oxidase substrate-binding domain-containing protein [Yinghuangia seranimata]MDI2125134.1 cholesterol oxidase substrate-binding domain-containing protein [Yinghuangia seranimata]